ncbi:MAG: 2-succinyl-5-enolpyruvyl-6-hydroxy-3-cyclohexene-1-carboxylic-acid synthase [Puniceicoccales bacterium]|jgi:2-succinyl-5-enolpyruvyl-6-hydroxy-3-cyclohexene-1-carboxylate synthase|nr:2-succinyl-5-enolpyruvyl-6-hydroxy-3-cyclohexene-1-carboxylic-acid synthase [Puniceicoccales bacterium]
MQAKSAKAAIGFRNINALWGAIFARTLARCGITRAIISPGSRSTPLAYALADEPQITATAVLDERTAAFFALGHSKATRRPTVLLCTSGTAAANYLPAVIEAWHAQVPLLVVTADRPPELHDCGAGQTINQHHLYGTHTVGEFEAPLPDAGKDALARWRDLLSEALARTQAPIPGPVHINVPLRDPLSPAVFQAGFSYTLDEEKISPSAPAPALRPEADPAAILAWAANYERGLIVAGEAQPADPAAYAAAVTALARVLCWPVLADALNPVRHRAGQSGAVVISAYETILRESAQAATLRPDAILQLGQLPTGKTLRGWLGAVPLPTLLLSPGGRNLNPLHCAHRTLAHAITDFAPADTATTGTPRNPLWAAAWQKAQDAAAARLDSALDAEAALFEGKAVWLLARYLPADAIVILANSMPVRDAEYFWPVQSTHRRIYCNRGVNGIDGTLGTALGVAEGAGAPAVLLTGDLSFLHDSNALLLNGDFSGSLTVVLVNNKGGGIFNNLPVVRENVHFERFWGTPQAVDFSLLAAAHGVPFERITKWAQLIAAIDKLPARGLRILEITTDRAADAARRNELLAV